MYCPKCGSKLEDGAEFCPACGAQLSNQKNQIETKSKDKVSVGLCILSALIPLAGLILFFIWQEERPRQSKISGICALVAFIVEFIAGICAGVCVWYFALGGLSPDNKPIDKPGIIFPYPDYGNNNTQQPSQPDHSPASPVFNNSEDGVLIFANFGNGNQTCYDNLTDSIIVWNTRRVSVYNRVDGAERYSYDYTIRVSGVSAYNGTLCVGLGGTARQIVIIDLHTGESKTKSTEIEIAEIAATDGMVVFCDSDQWCNVGVMNLTDYSTEYIANNFYVPKIAINHKDKILYIVETNSSSCDFVIVDLNTLDFKTISNFGDYEYNREGVYYDGEYVHAFGNTYNGTTGAMVADCGHAEAVYSTEMYLTNTLCKNGKYSLISEYDSRTVVYNNNTKKIVYTMNLAATEIYYIGGDKYIASCGNSGYVGFIDLSKI